MNCLFLIESLFLKFLHLPVHVIAVGDVRSDWFKCVAESFNDDEQCNNNDTDPPMSLTNPHACNLKFSPILVDIVFSTVRKLKPSKATVLEKIPVKVIKLSSSIIAPSLTFIFNLSLTTYIYIIEWKRARVNPIFKPGDR